MGSEDADGRGRVLRYQGVDLGVRAPWVVVEEREAPGVGALRERDRVFNRRVTQKAQLRQLGRGVLGIVHQQVGALAQPDGCFVKDTSAIRPGPREIGL